MLSLINQAQKHLDRLAIIAEEGSFTYQDLLNYSHQVASVLLSQKTDLNQARIAFMIPSGFDYVATQWGIWRSGGIAVPICNKHPRPELEYVIDDTQADVIIAHPDYESTLRSIATEKGCRFWLTTELVSKNLAQLPDVDNDRRAMILYTSGTTGKPKGVVITHNNIKSQVTSLVEAWGWQKNDRILHVLPLHHIHGIVNILTCALWVGATCQMLRKFNATQVWRCLQTGKLTLFMAVPTIYVKLISYWQQADSQTQQQMSAGCQNMRLMVSGSAALPVQVLEQWQEITGQLLLERYGMTEIGMALSNPLNGKRLAGYVGKPLPGVKVRLVDEAGKEVESGMAGEIQVKGNNIFREYWQKPEATTEAFADGWFKTGDLAIEEDGNYRILGRLSVDIIKTGGYKVSALEIEEVLRTHPLIKDCAVVGVADQQWGEKVCVAIVSMNNTQLQLTDLRKWAKEKLATYKVPTQMLIVEDLPRNAMGKVTKPLVKNLFNT